MATPQIPGGTCPSCHGSIIDVFAEWTDAYQTARGKPAILAGEIVFDCYYCQSPLQLVLPLALISPHRTPGQYTIARRSKLRCEEWLRSQHPGKSLSNIVEAASWVHNGKWAFDGYNWLEGEVHYHGQDLPPSIQGTTP